MKPKVAFFDFASCEGCQLAVLELETSCSTCSAWWRSSISARRWTTGATITTSRSSKARSRGRPTCRACRRSATRRRSASPSAPAPPPAASTRSRTPRPTSRRSAATSTAKRRTASTPSPTEPMKQVIKVDYELFGCPINKDEFVELVKCLLAGRPFVNKNYPVCVECKQNGNICVFHKKMTASARSPAPGATPSARTTATSARLPRWWTTRTPRPPARCSPSTAIPSRTSSASHALQSHYGGAQEMRNIDSASITSRGSRATATSS